LSVTLDRQYPNVIPIESHFCELKTARENRPAIFRPIFSNMRDFSDRCRCANDPWRNVQAAGGRRMLFFPDGQAALIGLAKGRVVHLRCCQPATPPSFGEGKPASFTTRCSRKLKLGPTTANTTNKGLPCPSEINLDEKVPPAPAPRQARPRTEPGARATLMPANLRSSAPGGPFKPDRYRY